MWSGTLSGSTIQKPGGLVSDSTSQPMYVDAATRQGLAFGTEDFTIIMKIIYGSQSDSFPVFCSNGDTGTGEWMFRRLVSSEKIGFYGNTGDISVTGVFQAWSAGTEYIIAANRINGVVTVYDYTAAGDYIGEESDATATADLNALDVTAGFHGADDAATRWFIGTTKYAFVWKGRGFSASGISAFIADPYQFLIPG